MATATESSSRRTVRPPKRTSKNTQQNQYGLIILGNSGVGKSFLANILVGYEAFKHEFSAAAVTTDTEYVELRIGGSPLAIFNIPGLIEAQQERVNLNKAEIDKAFQERPNSVVVFVFGHQNGRIRDEDVVAFNAINAAYPFRSESLVIVVNGIPKQRPANYEGVTMTLLQKLLVNIDVNSENFCFLDQIDEISAQERQALKERLLQVIVEFSPTVHEKVQEIMTLTNELQKAKKDIKEQQKQFEGQIIAFQTQINEKQRAYEQAIAKHQSEMQSLHHALEKQQKKFNKMLKAQRAELKELEEDLKEARKARDESKNSRENNPTPLPEAQKEEEDTLKEENDTTKGGSCTIH